MFETYNAAQRRQLLIVVDSSTRNPNKSAPWTASLQRAKHVDLTYDQGPAVQQLNGE